MERNVREAERMGGRASGEKRTQKRYLRSERGLSKEMERGRLERIRDDGEALEEKGLKDAYKETNITVKVLITLRWEKS